MCGLGQHANVVEPVVLAVEAGGVVAPHGAQQLEDLVGARPSILEAVPEGGELSR